MFRSNYKLFLGWLIAVIIGVTTMAAPLATAATSVVVSGRVYNASTGVGYAGVTINLCNGTKTAVTGTNGTWQALIPLSGAYCARIVSGVPGGVSGPTTLNRANVGAVTSYENQMAGINCYQNASCVAPYTSWDRAGDNNTDFIYRNAPVSTPVRTPPPGPEPAVQAPAPAPVPATAAVAAPANFTAKPADATDVISLAWSTVPGATYSLERSLDQNTWTTINSNVTTISYQDLGLKPDVTYYYRLTAQIDKVSSTPVTANAKTAAILATSTVATTQIKSNDGVAIASIPNASIPAGATCKVDKSNAPKPATGTKVLTDAYRVTCINGSDDTVSLDDTELAWSLSLGDRTKGYPQPKGVSYTDQNEATSQSSQYDTATKILTFSAPQDQRVAAMATIPSMAWLNWVAIGIVILMVVVAVLFLPLRHQRRLNYQEYLRSKYYNL